MKNKILILGSTGMAGYVIKTYLNETGQFEIYDLARSDKYFKPFYKIDITNFEIISELINKNSFEYIINCIGVLNKNSEENPDLAILINSYLPHFLSKCTKNTNTKIIHISTDCVFSGNRGEYLENDFKDGIGYYAQSKALGEILNGKDLTIRTSIIGPELDKDGVGIFNWLINQSGEINGYTHAYWSGVTTLELAKTISILINKSNFPSGLIHLTNNSKISKFDLLNIIKNTFNLTNVLIKKFDKYKVDKSLKNTNFNLNLNIPSYYEMIMELKNWMENNIF
jgi:dTDP-4-dehydrorhamnose reductase